MGCVCLCVCECVCACKCVCSMREREREKTGEANGRLFNLYIEDVLSLQYPFCVNALLAKLCRFTI